nr:hypothetical protein [Tanacetum cinerariifolium]
MPDSSNFRSPAVTLIPSFLLNWHFLTTVSYKLMLFGRMKDVAIKLMLLELARMGYEKPPPKLTVYKAFFSAQWKFLIHTLVQHWRFLSSKKGKEVREEEEIKAFRVKEVEEDADEDVTLVDVETQEEVADMDDELQGRIDDVSAAATKDVNVAEPTVFDDEEVTMTMAQTLIKMKAKKIRLLDEQMAKRLHDEEVEKAATKEKQEKNDLEKVKGLQQQYDDKQENINWNAIAEQIQGKHLDNIKKYQSIKRKPVSIAQARKNMIIYLKNMAGYKMEHFR